MNLLLYHLSHEAKAKKRPKMAQWGQTPSLNHMAALLGRPTKMPNRPWAGGNEANQRNDDEENHEGRYDKVTQLDLACLEQEPWSRRELRLLGAPTSCGYARVFQIPETCLQ